VEQLERDNMDLVRQLREEQEQQEASSARHAHRLNQLKQQHRHDLAQLAAVIASQKKVGDRWKKEMAELTSKFETRLQEGQQRNKAGAGQ